MEGALHTLGPSPGSITSWRTDWVTPRLPEVSSTRQRSPARSNTVILRKVPIWSTPALVRESDRNTIPAFSRRATQEVMAIPFYDKRESLPRAHRHFEMQRFVAAPGAHAAHRRLGAEDTAEGRAGSA